MENSMDKASNFALDYQELAQQGKLNKESLKELLEKYKAQKYDLTLSFDDGSSCNWVEKDGASYWKLQKHNPMLDEIPYPIRFAYDTELKQPACVLIQAGVGGFAGAANLFKTETWLTHPSENMGVFTVKDRGMMQALINITNEAAESKK